MRSIQRFFSSLKLSSALIAGAVLTGCDSGFQTLGAGEYGVVFNALPQVLGGGVQDRVLKPAEKEFIWPWQELIKVDTKVRVLSWGPKRGISGKVADDFLETRTKDGNEVSLSMTVQYSVASSPEAVRYVVERVGDTPEEIDNLVEVVARADIRTHMNTLSTEQYSRPEVRRAAVNRVRESMQARLAGEGISVTLVDYQGHLFERHRGDDKLADDRYQEEINNTQKLEEQKRLAENKRETLRENLRGELQKVEGENNKLIAEAEGEKRRAMIRGDAYLTQKRNEAEQRKAEELGKVESLRQKIEALGKEGADKVLRLAVAEELAQQKGSFMVLDSGSNTGGGGIDLRKTDTNELIRQLGVLGALAEGVSEPQKKEEPVSGVAR